MLSPWKKSFDKFLDSVLKTRDITLLTEFHLVKAVVFPVVMYGCESWTIKKAECRRIEHRWIELWCWRRLWVFSKSPLDWKEIKPVNPKGNQPWIFIGRTVFEVALFWPPDSKSQFIGTEPIHGKDERQKDKGMEEDEMVRHWWLTVKRVRFMTSEGKNFTFGWKAQLQSLRALCSKSFITVKKEYKNFWHRHQKGAESAPFTYFSGALYNFSIYQTHSHNRHPKVTGLVRKFLLRRRKNFSNKIHYCYAIISTEHK